MGSIRFRGQCSCAGSGAAQAGGSLFSLGLQHGRFVIGRSFPSLKGNGPGGAAGQAVPQAVAVVLPGKISLAADEGDSPFMAGSNAQAAAVAFFLINVNNLTNHGWFLRLFLYVGY